jgi:glycerol-3-phosphate acyltransferase PlsY
MLNALYTILICFAFAFIGYSLGCFLFSELLGKAVGKNIRELGSKNPGATNLSRNTSKIYGLCGAFLDAIKSYIAVILALIIFRYSIYY